MPHCQNCDFKWDWRTSFKKTLSFNTGTTCPNCQKIQYVTTKTRQRALWLYLLVFLFIYLVITILNLEVDSAIYLAIITYVMFLIFYPTTIKLTNKYELLNPK